MLEICSIGQIWTTARLMHQKESVCTGSLREMTICPETCSLAHIWLCTYRLYGRTNSCRFVLNNIFVIALHKISNLFCAKIRKHNICFRIALHSTTNLLICVLREIIALAVALQSYSYLNSFV